MLLKLGWGDGKYIDASDRTKAELYRSKLLCGMVQYYQCPVIYPYLYHEFHIIHRLCGSPSIPLSFNLATVLPRRSISRVSYATKVSSTPTAN